jgi:hypothetical protein
MVKEKSILRNIHSESTKRAMLPTRNTIGIPSNLGEVRYTCGRADALYICAFQSSLSEHVPRTS